MSTLPHKDFLFLTQICGQVLLENDRRSIPLCLIFGVCQLAKCVPTLQEFGPIFGLTVKMLWLNIFWACCWRGQLNKKLDRGFAPGIDICTGLTDTLSLALKEGMLLPPPNHSDAGLLTGPASSSSPTRCSRSPPGSTTCSMTAAPVRLPTGAAHAH